MQTVTIPDWLIKLVQLIDRNNMAIIGVFVLALVGSVLVEVLKRWLNKRREVQEAEQLSKKAVGWLVVAVHGVLTFAGYLAVFGSQHHSVLGSLPYIGQGVTEVIGVSTVLYNLRFNKTFDAIANRLNKWSSKKSAPVIEDAPLDYLDKLAPTPPNSPLPAVDENPFVN